MEKIRNDRRAGIILSLLIYVLAGVVAVAVGKQLTHLHPLIMIFYADVAATVVVFIFSMILNNSSVYDPYWSVKPPFIAAVYLFMAGPEAGIRLWLAFILLFLYGLRLTHNFYRGWTGFNHEDWRYVNFRRQFPGFYWTVSFVGIHFFPTLMVYLGCLPLYAIYVNGGTPLNILDYAGMLIILTSVMVAWTADNQLLDFRKRAMSNKEILSSGLWSVSRHPNYLGEVSTWWGLFLIGLGAGTGFWWTGAGALAITLMFLFISIPMIEKRHLESKPDYSVYRKRVPVLVPYLKRR